MKIKKYFVVVVESKKHNIPGDTTLVEASNIFNTKEQAIKCVKGCIKNYTYKASKVKLTKDDRELSGKIFQMSIKRFKLDFIVFEKLMENKNER